jgi:hypothetical protein
MRHSFDHLVGAGNQRRRLCRATGAAAKAFDLKDPAHRFMRAAD